MMLECVIYFQEERTYKWKNVETGKKSRSKEIKKLEIEENYDTKHLLDT